jgi:IS5 family transposase
MAHRVSGQGSLAEALVSAKAGANERLGRIAAVVDWSGFAALLSDLHASPTGRPAYPALLMFRCLLLGQWYGLSDPGLEEALNDRLSFRAFAGLGLDETAPDHSTLSRFRTALAERSGRLEALLGELNRQLDARGLVLRQGTLIDATLVEADARPRRHALGSRCDSDKDARWAARKGRRCFGYKAHIAVDAGSGLVRAAVLTPANVADSTVAERLIQGDEEAVYADRGCDQEARRARRLAAQGIADGILRRRRRNTTPAEAAAIAARNKLLAPLRAPVERLFGLWKRCYGFRRVRYRSLARNAAQLGLLAIATNLRRAVALAA